MTAYLIRRLLAVIPVMAVVVTVVFLLDPPDPRRSGRASCSGPTRHPAQIDGVRQALGLDRPLAEQLLLFYKRILRGDLGPLLLPRPARDPGALGARGADARPDGERAARRAP